MDPLRCLRDFWAGNRSHLVSFVDGNRRIKFGEEYEFSSSSSTRFKNSNGEPYQLGALLFFMQKKNLEAAKYMQDAKAAGVARVARADQQNITNFLTGARAEADIANITSEAAAPARSKRARDNAVAAEPASSRFVLAEHERKLRCRDNMFLVANKDFSKLDAIYKEAEKAFLAECTQIEGKAKSGSQAPSAVAAARPQNRLERAPEGPSEKQKQLGVDIYGARAAPSVPAAPGKPGSSSAQRHSAGQKRTGSAPAQEAKQKPIIIVPQGDTALVNILNAPKLLGEGKFVSVSAARAALAGEQVQQPVSIARPSPADPKRTVKFEIIDQPPSKKSDRWDRVVAVVCLGKKWQFADFPFTGAKDGKTVDMFASVVGYYFHFRDEAVPESVRSWNVKQLSLDRNARHSDAQVAQEFFKHLAARLDARKTDSSAKTGSKPQKLLYK